DELARIDGVGDVGLLGQLDYSMRVWLDPERLAGLNMTASDILEALREQNIQVAAGAIGRPPIPAGQAFQYSLSTRGRLLTAEEFGMIVVKSTADGRINYLRDVVTERRQTEDGRE
ncbi:MAG: efflux RND transporter permease subunit, partial [Pirellulaceae bacterium]